MLTLPVKTEFKFAALALTATTVGACIYAWYKNRKVYIKVGTVKDLYFFPLKSGRGMKVNELKCGSQGAEHLGMRDREFMLINDEGVLISQREEPSLVLLQPEIDGDNLVIHGEGCYPLVVPFKKEISLDNKIVKCRIHSDEVTAADCGDDAAAWFQKYLKRTDVRMVRFSPDLLKRQYKFGDIPVWTKIKEQYPIRFQDSCAFHVCNEASLEDLQSKVDAKITVNNFRPNILISGASAYNEDNWKFLKFSSGVEFTVLLPCGRCLLTTNDPETGIKSDKEPLVTLRKYRMCKDRNVARALHHSPAFGVYCWMITGGSINVGDEIYAVFENQRFKF